MLVLELIQIHNSVFTLLFFVTYSAYLFSNSYDSNCYNWNLYNSAKFQL